MTDTTAEPRRRTPPPRPDPDDPPLRRARPGRSTSVPSSPGRPAGRSERRRAQLRRRRQVAALLAALVLVPTVVLGGSLALAAQVPGNEALSAKWADWWKDHHAGPVVNRVERYWYDRQAPPTGGTPKGLASVPPTVGSGAATTPGSKAAGQDPAADRPPPAIPAIVAGLPGEGVWTPTGALVGGRPAIAVAQVRPDTVHTSVLVEAVWIDAHALRFTLVPGLREPGTSVPSTHQIDGPLRAKVVAAFNGGFRMKDSRGGFYLDGHTVGTLRDGAASLVLHRDGSVDVGQWGRDVRLDPTVVAVRQNLDLLVDHGKVPATVTATDQKRWGNTIGTAVLVWRSGVGIDAHGNLIYVAGHGLSALTLATTLVRAGAVRAMTLDMNPEWVTFNLYRHPDPTRPDDVVGTKLDPAMRRPADRYLTPDSRDFVAVSTP